MIDRPSAGFREADHYGRTIQRLQEENARLRELNRTLLTTIEDAVSVGEMQGEDFRLDPWASLRAAAERRRQREAGGSEEDQ